MFDSVAQVAQQGTKSIRKQIESRKNNVFEFNELAYKFTVDIIATCAFGIEVNSFNNSNNELQKAAKNISKLTSFKSILKIVGFKAAPEMMKALRITFFGDEVDEFFQQMIQEMMKIRQQKGIIRYDMVNILMQAKATQLTNDESKINQESQTGKKQTKSVWDDEDFAAQALCFFFAGFEIVSLKV